MAHLERVIILIDMDCFYCQVEEKLDPDLEGKPIAVVQYNAWRGGGIIAVNYPARDQGVTRHMRGEEAKQKCPDIVLAKVPQVRGKADLSKYRDAGKRVADVLQTFTNLLERASVDEAYLDVTNAVLSRMKDGINQVSIDKLKNTFVVGCDTPSFVHNLMNYPEYSESNFKLCIGGLIAEEIRAEVYKQTGYKCSAGIAHNKILAKLVCGLNKPNKQTILPHDAVSQFFESLPLAKVKNLGGKFGNALSEELNISKMGELSTFSEKQLVEKFGKKNGSWLYNIAKGIDLDPVVIRLISKSIGCCKRFPGKNALLTQDAIQHWMNELAGEIAERLEKDLEENNRRAKQMIISFAQENNMRSVSSSRTHPLNSYEQSQIAQDAIEVVRKSCQKSDGSYLVTFLGISVSNFQEQKKTVDIASFFRKSINLEQNVDSKNEEKETTEIQTDEETGKVNYNGADNDEDGENQSTYSENINSKTEEKEEAEIKALYTQQFDTLKTNENAENMNYKETDNDEDDGENHSIYSASTEELEEDPKSYIYFEDIYPELVSSQPLESDHLTQAGKSSISDDVEYNKNELERRVQSSKSFFSKYFESPLKNCNTPELDNSNENNDGNDETAMDEVCSLQVAQNGAKINETEDNDGLVVLQTESDVRTEEKRKSNELDRINTGVKRKASENNLLQYFPQSEIPDENYCAECKKNIPLKDIFDHSDYHVAKKLQSELNKTIKAPTPSVSKNIKVKQKIKKVTNVMSISNFFKPV